jgi:NAD(P)-dependent dehydrogenase (short-subunit alcohol dehydrogenase family)
MELGLRGKVVVITGGSKGIGLACARAFLEEGAKVGIVSRAEENLDRARAELGQGDDRLVCHAADLIDAAAARGAVEAMEAALGPIDVLVTSAGAAQRTPPNELTPAHWRAAMDAKYFSYVNVIDPVIKRMAARGRGVIVNVIGNGGKVASPIHIPGGAANAALMLATAGLANAYAANGVRVIGLNPGLTATGRVEEGMRADAAARGISLEEALRAGIAKIPLGRMAEPGEIASAALFLASDRASYITGVTISMDGASVPTVV